MRRIGRRFALVFALTGCLSGCGSSSGGTSVRADGSGGFSHGHAGTSTAGGTSHSGSAPSSGGAASSTGSQAGAEAGSESGAAGKNTGMKCAAALARNAQAVGVAVDALNTLLGQLNQSVAVSCANLATDLGTGLPDAGGIPPNAVDLAAQCDSAVEALSSDDAVFVVEGGACAVDFLAALDCEATCSGGSCVDDTLEQRCPNGRYASECATCTANSRCLGSSEIPARCTGTCAGICDGACRGECTAEQNTSVEDCYGSCDGVCDGTCTGSCLLASDTACGKEVPCQGECATDSGEGSCAAMPREPACDLSVECTAACGALAALRARCVPPTVVVIDATSDELAASVEAHLPALLSAEQGPGGIARAALADSGLADLATLTAQQIADDPACLGGFGQAFVDKLRTAAKSEERVAAAVEAASAVRAAITPE